MNKQHPTLTYTKAIAIVLSLLIIALGVMVIIGWYTNNLSLLQVLPTAVAMQYNTALGFILAGLCLFLSIQNYRQVLSVIAILLTMLGVLTFSEYIFNYNLGIDELFMDHYITDKVTFKGRMAPNTALSFSLTGIIFLINSFYKNKKTKYAAIGVLGVLVIILGALAFIGYFIDLDTVYLWGDLTKMAIHTAFGFILIGSGVLIGVWFINSGRVWIESSITRRLSIYIIVPILILYLLLATYSIHIIKEATLKEAHLKLKELGWYNTSKIDKRLNNFEEVARSTKRFILTQEKLTNNEINAVLKSNLAFDPAIHGSAIAFAPYAFIKNKRLYAPYAYIENEKVKVVDYSTVSYDYADGTHDWYEIPKNENRGMWSEPYFDDRIENAWMATYSLPVFMDEVLFAVITIDIILTNIDKVFNTQELNKFAYGVISGKANYLFTSYNKKIIGQNMYDQGDTRSMRQEDRSLLAGEMLKGKSGYKAVPLTGGDAFLAIYNPIGDTGWIFFVGLNQSFALATVKKVSLRMGVFFIVTLFFFIIIIYFASKQLTKRIQKLNSATNQIAQGKLDTQIDVLYGDEIGVLSQNFAIMATQLATREKELKAFNIELETKVKERTNQLEQAIEELKVTQEITKESEEKFKALFDSTALPLCYVDNNGNIELINEQFTKVFGYTISDVPNLDTWWEKSYPDPEYRAWVLKTWNQSVENAQKTNAVIESIEYKVTCKNGDIRTIIIGGTTLKDNFLATFYDVTERIKTEEALKETGNRLSQAMDSAKMGSWVFNPAQNKMILDKENLSLLGIQEEEFDGSLDTWLTFIHPEDSEKVAKNTRNAIQNKNRYDDDYRIIRADGEIRYHTTRGEFFIDKDGQKSQFTGLTWDITEQKETQKRIEQSEFMFRSLVSNMPGVVYRCGLVDPWEMFFISDEIEVLSGYPKTDFLGVKPKRTFADIMHPDDRVPTSENAQAAIDAKKPYINEYRIIHKSGEIRYAYAKGQAFYKKDGSPDFLVGTIFDDTNRKKLELQVDIERTQLKKYLDYSPIAVTITVDGIIKYVNQKFNAVFGSVPGDSVLARYGDKKDREAVLASLNKEKALVNYQIEYLDKNNKALNTLISTNKVSFNDEEALLSWVVDITELKHIEKELQKANEEQANRMHQLNQMVISLPIATALFEPDGKIIILNQKFTDLLGYDIKDMPNINNHWELFYPDKAYREELYQQYIVDMENTKKAGNPIKPFEAIITDKSGNNHVVEVHNQSVGGLSLSMLVDLDERKQFEESLKEAKNIADEANRLKSSFLANMSHEIRTPMNAVLGFSELLENLVESSLGKSYLKSIQSSGKSLMTLINDILDLSKIEAGKLDLDYTYFDINSILEDMKSIFSLKVKEKGIDFIVEIDDTLPLYINSDEIRLRQILINLINNAIKFTESGYVKLALGVKQMPTDKKGRQWVNLSLSVEDTGIGISKDYLNRLFETFTQQDGKTTKKYGGTGLGLSISKNLAKLMNGDIHVESEDGKGSTFTLSLNCVQITEDVEILPVEEKFELEGVSFEPASILVVDDIIDNRNYIKGVLHDYSFNIIEAEDGIEALEKLNNSAVDLIITDLRMPNMDGFELIKRVHENKQTKHIPIIATSASVMAFNQEKAKTLKFDDFLPKPVRIGELITCLIKFLPYHKEEVQEKVTKPEENQIINIKDVKAFSITLNKLIQKQEELKEHQSMGDAEDFANDIAQLGDEYNIQSLSEYSKLLKTAIDNFDVEAMLNLINRFTEEVNNINKHLKQQ